MREKRFVYSDGSYVAFNYNASYYDFVKATGRTVYDHVEYYVNGKEVNSWNF